MSSILDTIYEKSPETAWGGVEGETIIIDLKAKRVIGINDVASIIWEALDGKTALREIVKTRVLTEFEIEEEQALYDAEKWIAEIAQQGLAIHVTAK